MRIIGFDYGDSRIGVAVSDLLGLTAQSVGLIAEKNFEKQVIKVLEYCDEYKAEKIVLGMPKNMNGTIGERGEKTQLFADALREKTSVPIIFWDERLTTAAADRAMLEMGIKQSVKGMNDKLAAVFILQGYLDSQR